MFKPESSRKLKLWNQSIACCSWSGVTCDGEGQVIGLDLSGEYFFGGFDNTSSLFSLQHLQKLNLAYNNFISVIPSGFNKLVMLNYLNFSYASFVGKIPIDGVSIKAQGQEWSNALLPLCDLQVLSMSNCDLSGPLDSSLIKLENLSVIILDGNKFSSPVPQTFAKFKNLTIFSLAFCGLIGTFPQKIFQIRTLSNIDLSFNYDLHGSFPEFPSNGSIQTLRVSNTSFSGEFPHTIGNIRHLYELDLYNCQFNGTLPNFLSNLTQLSYLDLSSNSFTGPMPSFGMAKNLIHLDLSHNRLSGPIPTSSHFEGLHNIVSIDLGFNSIIGSIPSFLFKLTSLQKIWLSFNRFSKFDQLNNVSSSVVNTLDLSSNDLSGPFPTSIFQLRSLSIINLSSNRLNGSLQLDELLDLRNIIALDLSYNNISIAVNVANADHTFLANISTLNLASCNLNTFPSFLRNKSKLTMLDLSNNHIQGKVPNWIWKIPNLQSLNVSHNMLTDLEGPLQNITSNLIELDLHNNQLKGTILVFPKYATYLDYSMNKFSSVIPQDIGNYLPFTTFLSLSNNNLLGSIPDSLCNASNLQVLDISINNISGTIPSCLMNMTQTLVVLNLRMNNLIGTIPDVFPSSCGLRTLDLSKNNLDGQIPISLVKCSALEVLDLSNNNIVDRFPCLLKKISTLRVLVLRKNEFYGPIKCPATDDTWHMLQIIDLAFNNFSGKQPEQFFTMWEAMMSDNDQIESKVNHIQFQVLQYGQIYYQDSVTVASKGQQLELVRIMTIYTTVDLSSNLFEGTIPNVLMDFNALYVLNFSNNRLSGEIPSSIGNMKQLESLDLSNNSFDSEIPVQLERLHFLSYLNLSYNHFKGKIPTGTQLQSFPASSFEGNDGLYGPPLTEIPDGKRQDELHPQLSCGRLACSIDWNFLSVELGLVFGLGIVIGPLMFWKQWRIKYWKLVDKIICWMFSRMHLEYVTDRRQTYIVLRRH
ncbi:receptor protein [Trifolium repens]|nr:receptor protein [Trifolium repens]